MTYTTILKKTWYKYIIFIVLIMGTISSFVFYGANATKIFLFAAAAIILLIGVGILLAISAYAKQTMVLNLHFIKKYLRTLNYKLRLMRDFNTILTHQYANHSVEIIFAMFVHFYEHHLIEEIDTWAFPEEVFPEGKFALTKLYKYIKKTRTDNQDELRNIEFDTDKNKFKYWGEYYSNFSFRIKDDQLVVQSSDDESNVDSFYRKRMKMENELYNLDNEKAKWIIERRKHLMI